jgi:hypothetical protein
LGGLAALWQRASWASARSAEITTLSLGTTIATEFAFTH